MPDNHYKITMKYNDASVDVLDWLAARIDNLSYYSRDNLSNLTAWTTTIEFNLKSDFDHFKLIFNKKI